MFSSDRVTHAGVGSREVCHLLTADPTSDDEVACFPAPFLQWMPGTQQLSI
jgi:hypothetical protein